MPKSPLNKKYGLLFIGFGLLIGLGILNLRSLPHSDQEVKPAYSQAAGQTDLADSFIRKASQNFYYREFPQAAENYYKAIAIYESRQDFLHIASTYEALGDLHIMSHETDEAENNFAQAADYYSQAHFDQGQTNAFKNIGDLHVKMEDYDSAGEWYAKALAVNEGGSPHVTFGKVQEAIGHLYWKTNKISEAIKSFKRARETFVSVKYVLGYEHLTHVINRLNKISRQQRGKAAPPEPPGSLPY